MATFDTVIVPTALTPANISEATLYTALSDTSVIIRAASIDPTSTTLTIRVGVQPASGSTHWYAFDLPLPPGDAISFGPVFLRVNDLVRVRTSIADDATFSVSGVRTTPG